MPAYYTIRQTKGDALHVVPVMVALTQFCSWFKLVLVSFSCEMEKYTLLPLLSEPERLNRKRIIIIYLRG